jgi:hypothetical protein
MITDCDKVELIERESATFCYSRTFHFIQAIMLIFPKLGLQRLHKRRRHLHDLFQSDVYNGNKFWNVALKPGGIWVPAWTLVKCLYSVALSPAVVKLDMPLA